MSEPLALRPEIYRDQVDSSSFGVVQKPLSTWERIYNQSAVRKVFILIMLAVLWEIYSRLLNNALLFPTFTSTIEAFYEAIVHGGLLGKAWTSIKVLLIGYSAGIALAALLTVVAITSRFGTDLLETLTSMFNPLPAIALLPLALIWFGLGNGSLVFVLIHSVLWAVALNTHSGFLSVSNTMRMVGRNYGLRGLILCRTHPHSGGIPEHPDRTQDWLGVRLADLDRRRAGVRRFVGVGWPRMVHLREQESARDPERIRRPVYRDRHRPAGRKRHFPHH